MLDFECGPTLIMTPKGSYNSKGKALIVLVILIIKTIGDRCRAAGVIYSISRADRPRLGLSYLSVGSFPNRSNNYSQLEF